jgi:hypothetical protein
MAMRRTYSARGAALAALALLTALTLLGAGDPKKKKAPEPPAPKIDENIGTVAVVISGELPVEGVGLVVGLANTGSNPPPSTMRTRLLNDMRKARVEHPDQWLDQPGCSMVVVRAVLPNGLTTRDPIDVDIELPPASGTTSLAGGRLLATELAPVMKTAQGDKEGKVFAIAGGPIMTGNLADPKDLKVGRVLGGGRVKTDIPYNLVIKDDRRSARTVKLVEDTIGLRFHENKSGEQKGMAKSMRSDQRLILNVPKVYHHNQSRYFQVIEHLSLVDNPSLRAKRMEVWGKELLDPKTAGKAALKLEGLGSNSIPTLKVGLASADPQVKFFSAEALAYLGNVEGAEALADTATKRPEFRSYALKALAAMDQAAGVMRLRKLMGQSEVELRYGAFDALRSFDQEDPFLGEVSLFEAEADDGLALQIPGEGRAPRIPVKEQPFKLYVVDSEGPPLVHVSRNLRAEVVLFGKGQKILPPAVLGAGGPVLLNASDGDDQVQISRIVANLPDSRVSSSLEIVDLIRKAATVGATYPDIVGILTAASDQKNLPGPLVVDAIPVPNKTYTEIQLLGSASKKDDAIKKAGAEETPKKPGMLDRLRERFNR